MLSRILLAESREKGAVVAGIASQQAIISSDLTMTPIDELKAIVAHRVGMIIANTCNGQSLSGIVTPAKITCGKRMIGKMLVAVSVLEETAEMTRPTTRPASEQSTNVINTSR